MGVNIVSQPPLMTPMLDPTGRISKAWAIWFRDIYNRTAFKGGNSIDINATAIDQINIDIDALSEQILTNIENIKQNADAILVNSLAIAQNTSDISENTDAIAILQPDPRDVTEDTTAAQYEYLSVTCSTVDITIILPLASLTPGVSIWINKVDATVFKVLTSVKDIFFQGSTLHLISNGTDWIPS